MTTTKQPAEHAAWYALSAGEAARAMNVDPDRGLASGDVTERLAEYGPNELPTEPPPSMWVVARGQLANPMNIMLLIVCVASFAIAQVATGIVVLGLVTFNVVMGSAQELKARASVEALAKLQVPQARVRRSGQVEELESTQLVPGDVVLLEAGDVVPADGRILTSATLEVQEAALTGESAPIPKDRVALPEGEVALGDRTNLVFQNTQVTRGTATFVVTATGEATEIGRIAGLVTATKRTRSPLQRELDGMTKVFGLLAFLAVAVIAIFGLVRGQDTTTLVLLCISTAIAAIPTGLPTFVQAMLSSGARRLVEAKAVVKSLSDVETLGGTTVINSDKTGTLTLNAMTATTMLGGGDWFKIEGPGYQKTGAILGVAGGETPDFHRLALGLVLCTDATVADDGSVIGDPTEAAFVVLAAKMGADAEQTRETLPRRAEVPFDSEYKFMATFHDRPDWLAGGILTQPHFESVKGAPDVVLERCAYALWHGQQAPVATVRDEILAANRQLSERGLRVLAFAVRDLDDQAMTAALADPMAAVADLVFVALVGIMDPLRTEARDAVHAALAAGIDVRMITGDHTVTARAIADELGLGPGVITGTELQHLPDAEVIEPASPAARVRPGGTRGQAAPGQAHAAIRRRGRDDRRRRQRRRRAQAGRHRRGHGQRLGGNQAGGQDRADRRQLRHPGQGRRPRPRHLPPDLHLHPDAADHLVLGPAADGLRHHPQHQPRRRPVPPPAAVLQVLRRHHRGHRVHRRRPRPRGHAAATTQARHQDRQPAPDHPLVRHRVRARRHRPGRARVGTRQAQHHPSVGQHDHGLRHRLVQRSQHRPDHAPRTPGPVVLAGIPLHGLDHPRLDPHLGRRAN